MLGETPTLPTVLVGLFAGVATVAVSGLRFASALNPFPMRYYSQNNNASPVEDSPWRSSDLRRGEQLTDNE